MFNWNISFNRRERMNFIKLIIRIFIFSQIVFFAQAHDLNYDHSMISPLSSFRIMGVIELRTEKDKTSPVVYRTLNHEGGMKVRVLEVLEKDTLEDKKGMWLYVLLTEPMWSDTSDWIEKYHKFLIFLPDDMVIFDFEN